MLSRTEGLLLAHLEEGVPVNVLHHILNGEGLEHLGANDAGLHRLVDGVLPVNHKGLGLGLRLGQGQVPAGSILSGRGTDSTEASAYGTAD